MRAPIELSTTRLRLRQWQNSDYAPFADMNADPVVMEHFPQPLSQQQSDTMAQRLRADIARNGWGLWAVQVRDSERFIGLVGLIDHPNRFPIAPCVEIGWRLAAAHWGQGYATEAARAVLRFGFETRRLNEIVSFTTASNTRSRRVMERIGLKATGETFEHPSVPPGHVLCRHVVYRLQRAAWLASRP